MGRRTTHVCWMTALDASYADNDVLYSCRAAAPATFSYSALQVEPRPCLHIHLVPWTVLLLLLLKFPYRITTVGSTQLPHDVTLRVVVPDPVCWTHVDPRWERPRFPTLRCYGPIYTLDIRPGAHSRYVPLPHSCCTVGQPLTFGPRLRCCCDLRLVGRWLILVDC